MMFESSCGCLLHVILLCLSHLSCLVPLCTIREENLLALNKPTSSWFGVVQRHAAAVG